MREVNKFLILSAAPIGRVTAVSAMERPRNPPNIIGKTRSKIIMQFDVKNKSYHLRNAERSFST
jgi:hypothetical protein